MKHYILFLLLILTYSFCGYTQVVIDPYAETEGVNTENEPGIIKINPSEINVLSGINAMTSSNLKQTVLNHMYMWTSSIDSGPYYFTWNVKAGNQGNYDVTAVAKGEDAKLILSCNGKTVQKEGNQTDWSRILIGTIELKNGINQIEIEIQANKEVKLAGIELTQPMVKKKLMEEALGMRNDADWFKDAGYGLMFQWTNRATPKQGNTLKDWEDKTNDFDLDAFVELVERSGATYVIWSLTWGQQYISAPIQSLDKLIAGRTTKRDLLGEMADRLAEKDIKLIFYYHYGYDCYHSKDSVWLKVAGGYQEDKTELYQNISKIVSEVGERYGNKLHGWFFDGGRRYYDSHFDGSSSEGILSAPFKDITQSARTGNPQRIIAYNPWILPLETEFQDYYAGEGYKRFTDLDEGVFPDGKYEGLMAHSCFVLEKSWGHIEWNTSIIAPKYSLEKLTESIRHAQKNRYPLSINLEMYEDGTVSPDSYELLEKVRIQIRGE